MDMKYCQDCGCRNELDAVFCKKCGHSFARLAVSHTPPPEHPKQDFSLPVPPRKRGPLKAASPPAPEVMEAEAATQDDDEGDGVSLNFVPQVQLEVESVEIDEVKKVTFGALVEQAQREKAQKGAS